MLAKFLIIVLFIAMVASLCIAMRHMLRDRGQGDSTVRALTIRVGIWVVLFLFIAIGLYSGFLSPGDSLQKAAQPVIEH